MSTAPTDPTAHPSSDAPSLVLVRHGETEWSRTHRHTGRTDIGLTGVGEQQARACAAALGDTSRFGVVLASPLQRAARTAELAGLRAEPEPDLVEWDYGQLEGLTTAEIRANQPGWTVWTGAVPGGETAADVGRRADRVLSRLRPVLAAGRDVCLVGHGHTLRVLGARWLGLAPEQGALLRLDTATVSRLGFEHGTPVVLTWNAPPPSGPTS